MTIRRHPGFYQPWPTPEPRLVREPARVEVVPIASHWEAARRPRNLLARAGSGDRPQLQPAFLCRPASARTGNRQWLDRLAVGYVALLADTEPTTPGEGGGPDPPRASVPQEIPVGGDWRPFKVIGAADGRPSGLPD